MLHLLLPPTKLVQMTKFTCQNVHGTKIYFWFAKSCTESSVSTKLLVKTPQFQWQFWPQKLQIFPKDCSSKISHNFYIFWVIYKVRASFEICITWGFQKCPWLLYLMNKYLRNSWLKIKNRNLMNHPLLSM